MNDVTAPLIFLGVTLLVYGAIVLSLCKAASRGDE